MTGWQYNDWDERIIGNGLNKFIDSWAIQVLRPCIPVADLSSSEAVYRVFLFAYGLLESEA